MEMGAIISARTVNEGTRSLSMTNGYGRICRPSVRSRLILMGTILALHWICHLLGFSGITLWGVVLGLAVQSMAYPRDKVKRTQHRIANCTLKERKLWIENCERIARPERELQIENCEWELNLMREECKYPSSTVLLIREAALVVCRTRHLRTTFTASLPLCLPFSCQPSVHHAFPTHGVIPQPPRRDLRSSDGHVKRVQN